MDNPYTYYCYDHRDQITTGPDPSEKRPPVCPKCQMNMYYVAGGGTELPGPVKVQGMTRRKSYGIGTRAGQR